jgi:hypothetical protein
MGKDTAEPDEAAVLRKPQANPAATPSTKDQTSYSNQAGIISLSLTRSMLKEISSRFPRLPHTGVGDRHRMAAPGCTNAVCTVA